MKTLFAMAMAAILSLPTVQAQAAGKEAAIKEDVSRCLADATSEQDRELLVRWIFTAVTAHPSLSELSSLPDAQRERINKDTAAIFKRLIESDCRSAIEQAKLTRGGEDAVGEAFGTLGEMAVGRMFEHASVQDAMQGMFKHFEEPAGK